MQSYFDSLSSRLLASLRSDEVLTLFIEAEESDFVRFNHALVRQAGTVRQAMLLLDLIVGQRHAPARYTLSGNLEDDVSRGLNMIGSLRQTIPYCGTESHS